MIPSLGRLYVQDLTPVRVQQYYGELRRKGLANNTIRKHHSIVFTIPLSCACFFARAKARRSRWPSSSRAASACGAARSAVLNGAMST